MRPSRVRRPHPLAAAGSALERFVLRHFGFRVVPAGTKDSSPPAPKPGGDAPGV
jgi:hypothetical protein